MLPFPSLFGGLFSLVLVVPVLSWSSPAPRSERSRLVLRAACWQQHPPTSLQQPSHLPGVKATWAILRLEGLGPVEFHRAGKTQSKPAGWLQQQSKNFGQQRGDAARLYFGLPQNRWLSDNDSSSEDKGPQIIILLCSLFAITQIMQTKTG